MKLNFIFMQIKNICRPGLEREISSETVESASRQKRSLHFWILDESIIYFSLRWNKNI